MINNLWKRYEFIIVKYIDINRQMYSFIGFFISMIPFLIFNYLVFKLILNLDIDYVNVFLVGVSFGEARIFLVWLMYKNKIFFGKGHNKFTILISVYSIGLAVIGINYVIITSINDIYNEKNIKTIFDNTIKSAPQINGDRHL